VLAADRVTKSKQQFNPPTQLEDSNKHAFQGYSGKSYNPDLEV
jgi:hypothetical protein